MTVAMRRLAPTSCGAVPGVGIGRFGASDIAATMHRRDPIRDHDARHMRRIGVDFPAGLKMAF